MFTDVRPIAFTGFIAAIAIAAGGCKRSAEPEGASAPSTSAAASGSAASVLTRPGPQARVAALRSAEDRRDLSGISEADVQSTEVATRRAAARALARIASDDARPTLLRLLSDEDPVTAAWAAFGLGWTCAGNEALNTAALVARSVTLPDAPASKSEGDLLDPAQTIARALGRCGGPDAEATLVAWLKGPRPRAAAAALGLGAIAGRQKVSDDTLVALAQAAAGGAGAAPLDEALFVFGRTELPNTTTLARVREIALQRLSGEAGDGRVFALRALGRTDAEATEALERVLTSPDAFRAIERVEAARALGRIGEAGQQALGRALSKLAMGTDKLALASLVSETFGPYQSALDALASPPPSEARAALSQLATLPMTDSETPAAITRRLTRLRCAAARLLAAPGAHDDTLLNTCDPDKNGEEGALARLSVLVKKPLDGPRRSVAFRAFFSSPSARVRAAAFEQLAAHREVADAPRLIAQGLSSEHPGTVAAAAHALVSRPDLAEEGGPEIEKALLSALSRTFAPDDLETVAALVAAAGATHAEAARKQLEQHCQSFSPTLRAHAQAALTLLGTKAASCRSAPARQSAADELSRFLSPKPTIVFETDAGELTLELDPSLAPVAVARLVDLASSGFYDDMAVHRVVPGFVVQFGDRAGDGTGGAGKEPLRCETSPVPFLPLSIGVALAGRDTGSSQFFVTLSRPPHLDGEYARIGRASGDWAAIVEGDRIRKARVTP